MRFENGKPSAANDALPGPWEIWDKINERRRANGIFWRFETGLAGYSQRQEQ
jgi:hypothetical protein